MLPTSSVTGNVYFNCIWSLSLLQEYFAPCEYATPVLAMHQMSEGGIAGLTEYEKRHQIASFEHLLGQILCHSKDANTQGAPVFKLISFARKFVIDHKISSLTWSTVYRHVCGFYITDTCNKLGLKSCLMSLSVSNFSSLCNALALDMVRHLVNLQSS